MQEQYRIGQIPLARAALGDVWVRLTGGAFDPGGLLASGGVADLGGNAQSGRRASHFGARDRRNVSG